MPDADAGLSGAVAAVCATIGGATDKKPRITIKQPSAFNDLVRKESKIARATQKIRQTREKNDRRGGAGTAMFTTVARS
ncbi:MAG: hypothetical protein OEO83_16605 [Alphaproteobacteria bacterium]|nr:hypothetical protein [Alphaproteobacteria bacterium]